MSELIPILIFGPLNNTSSQWDHKELRSILQTAINCPDVAGPIVPHGRFDPRYITLPLGSSFVNAIAFYMKKKGKPSVFEKRLSCLVKLETGELVDDFQRALDYHNIQLLYFDCIKDNFNGIKSIINSLGLHLSYDGTRIRCARVHGDLSIHCQSTSLFDSTSSVPSHNPNPSAMSPVSSLPYAHSHTSLVAEKPHGPVITNYQHHGMRSRTLSGQALASRLHSNMKYIPQSLKESKGAQNIQTLVEQLQKDDIWRITLFIAHTHQISDTLSNPEKDIHGQQLATMLNTLSDHCFEYKTSFAPSLSATRTTVHGLAAKLIISSTKTNEEIANKLYWGQLGEDPILLEYTIPADPVPKRFYAFVTGCEESQTSMPWTETYHANPSLFTLVFNRILEPPGLISTNRASIRLKPHSSSPLVNKVVSDITHLSSNPVFGILPSRLLALWVEICWQGARTIENAHQWHVANPWLWNTFQILSNRQRKSTRLRSFLIEELKKLQQPWNCAGWALPFIEPCTVTVEVDEATGKPLKQEKRDHHWVLLLPWSSNRPIELLDSLGRPRSSLVQAQVPAVHLIQQLTEHILIENQHYSSLPPDKITYFKSIISQWAILPVQCEMVQKNTLDCGFWVAIQTLGLMSYGIPLTWTENGMGEVRLFVLRHLKAAQDRKDPFLESVARNEEAYANSLLW